MWDWALMPLFPAWLPATSSVEAIEAKAWMGMNGAAGSCAVGRACCESWGFFSDRDHSLGCCMCPMSSAQHPGITTRAGQFWKSISYMSSPQFPSQRNKSIPESIRASFFFLLPPLASAFVFLYINTLKWKKKYVKKSVCQWHIDTVNAYSPLHLFSMSMLSIYLLDKYALINVTSNPRTHSINVKIGRRAWKQVRVWWEIFANLPSKLSNYVNEEFSKCQRCWRGWDLEGKKCKWWSRQPAGPQW